MANKLLKKRENNFVSRITQLDSNEFDREIHSLLFKQLLEIKKYLSPATMNSFECDIKLLLSLLIFKYSVLSKNSTFGQELLGLKYKNTLTKKQVVFFVLLNYILPYGKRKYEENSSKVNCDIVKKIIEKLEVVAKALHYINLIIFLKEGKYSTMIERFLKLEFSPVKLNRNIGYNYMTRELLWHGFMELLMYVPPLLNYKAMKRKLNKTFFSSSSKVCRSKKTVDFHTKTKCVICNDFPILPCQISSYCSHLSCYYCVKSNVIADENFQCPGCAETNTINKNIKFLIT